MITPLRKTTNRHWSQYNVAGREQIVIQFEGGKLTLMTGIEDVDGNEVASVEIVKASRAVMEERHDAVRTTVYVRNPKIKGLRDLEITDKDIKG